MAGTELASHDIVIGMASLGSAAGICEGKLLPDNLTRFQAHCQSAMAACRDCTWPENETRMLFLDRRQVLQSRQRMWLHVLVWPHSDDQPAEDSSDDAVQPSQPGMSASAAPSNLGSQYTLFWRRTNAESPGAPIALRLQMSCG